MSSTRKPQRSDGVATRDALLDATLRCLVRTGVQRTTIADVRRESGTNASSIYHQFKGLQGLTTALLNRTFERLFGHIAERVEAATDAQSAIEFLVDGHLEWIANNRDEGTVMYQAMALPLPAEDAERIAATKAKALAPVIMRFMALLGGEGLPLPLLEMEIVTMGPTHEACRRWLGGAPLEMKWMRAHLPRLAWATLSSALSERAG